MIKYQKYVEMYRGMLSRGEDEPEPTLEDIREVVAFGEMIFASPSVAQAFLYFCLHGASTAWTLQRELNLPEATAYRALNRLRLLGVVVPIIKISKTWVSRGGPRPTVWALEGASTEEVASALRLHCEGMD